VVLRGAALKTGIETEADDNFRGNVPSTAVSCHSARYWNFSLYRRCGSLLKGGMQRAQLDRTTASLFIYLFCLGALALAPYDFSIAHTSGRTLVWWNRSITDNEAGS
jgi:hypothetical protein